MGGQALVPVSLVSQNIGPNQPLPVNGRIELGFDRLLLPASITRQTFVLENAGGTMSYTPNIAYDPVTRIVSITPLANDPTQPFTVGQSYSVILVAPTAPGDQSGVRAIDLATLKGGQQRIEFTVSAATPTPPPTILIDFCRDINPIFQTSCSLPMCHGGSAPAAGLLLSDPTGIPRTVVGRVAQGSNTGPRSAASPPTLLFNEDMPIIDANGGSTGDPGNSWMMYKLLLANPSPEPVDSGAEEAGEEDAGAQGVADATVEAGPMDAGTGAREGGAGEGGVAEAGVADGGTADGGMEDGGAPAPVVVPPVDVSGTYAPLALQAPSPAERAVLSNYIQGRQMPFPPAPDPALIPPLTVSQLERMSLWIAQGAVSASCQ
jgi:hypothetical protein